MGLIYVDDSLHDRAGFILAACIYLPENPAQEIDKIIDTHGFDLSSFEFKSAARFLTDPKKIDVRNDLFKISRNCRMAVIVIPREKRIELGNECLKGIQQFLSTNNKIEYPLSIYLDEGMFSSKKEAERGVESVKIANCSFFVSKILKK